MLQTIKKIDWIFKNSGFPGEAKMYLGFMSFRAPPAALKQKNYHNFPNMQPIISYFRGLIKFMKRHLLTIVSKKLNVFSLCYRHASFFPFFIVTKFPATYAFHLCVEYDKKVYPFKQNMIRHMYKTDIM